MTDFQSGKPPSAKEITDALADFGLYHPLPIAKRMYSEYVNNKKYWYGDIAADQPDDYWKDIATMNWLSLYIDHVIPLAINQQSISQEDVIDRLKRGGNLNG